MRKLIFKNLFGDPPLLSGHPWDYMFFPTQIMFFMGGCVSYRIYTWIKTRPAKAYWSWLQYTVLIAIILFYSYWFQNNYYKQTLLFVAMILFIPASFIITKASRLDRYLGNLSYPIYISQMLVINVTRANAFPKLFGAGFTTLLLVIILSVFLEKWIAKPIENIKQRSFKKRFNSEKNNIDDKKILQTLI